MSKKNNKKNQNQFKVTPKVNDDDKIIQELEVKKEYLIKKLEEVKQEQNISRCSLDEVHGKYIDIMNVKNKEKKKFDAVGSDYKNQKLLLEANFKSDLLYLKNEHKNKTNKIQELSNKKDEINANNKKEMEEKENMLANIKTNMDQLSKFFSDQLGEIQKSLQDQLTEISKTFNISISDQLKKNEEKIISYDLSNNNKH